MRFISFLGAAGLACAITACDSSATAPVDQATPATTTAALAISDNACAGQIVAGIASTWPWAHDDRIAFPPPPGAIPLWLQIFGPQLGISTVPELQALFCD